MTATVEAPQARTMPFRSGVAGFLSGILGRDVRTRTVTERGSGGSHLELPGTAVRVTSGYSNDIGVALAEAQAAARNERKPLAIVISQRRGRNIANSFCVMSLQDYAHLLALATAKGKSDA